MIINRQFFSVDVEPSVERPGQWYAVVRDGYFSWFVDHDGYLLDIGQGRDSRYFNSIDDSEVAIATAALRGYERRPA